MGWSVQTDKQACRENSEEGLLKVIKHREVVWISGWKVGKEGDAVILKVREALLGVYHPFLSNLVTGIVSGRAIGGPRMRRTHSWR